jgi:hypothetical protein
MVVVRIVSVRGSNPNSLPLGVIAGTVDCKVVATVLKLSKEAIPLKVGMVPITWLEAMWVEENRGSGKGNHVSLK